MTRFLWLNPSFGIAGDMLLGALLDAGADEDFVRAVLHRLDVGGWDLEVSRTNRRGMASLKAKVITDSTVDHRPWSSIDTLLAEGTLPDQVARQGARKTFAALANVEAARHGIDLDDVQFHEVGAIDAIVDIVGAWAALVSLDIDEVHSSPPGLGTGTVQSEHGILAHPAPATLELLRGMPIGGLDTPIETTTPTGAALLATMVDRWGPVPSGTLVTSGYGAGDSDPTTHANVLGVSLIEGPEASDVSAVLIESNVDDVTPEILGHLIDRAIAEGADDAWLVPIVMKKSRPGHQIRILCSPTVHERLIDLILRETGTLGLRSHPVTKRVALRSMEKVEISGGSIRIKVGPYGAKPESEDVIRVAEATGETVRQVAAEALAAWSRDDLQRSDLES
ncbi:MAG: nickel pincer cofactor biosynthesis protein LarC [Acidimicrobiia bacterium]|nr:MAG: nickel pincer cofactor biosynthesis protein LarC [Acidimicrobiia bacterium]